MTIAYAPGEEIQLYSNDLKNVKTKFFSLAMSWREQRLFRAEIAALKQIEGDETGTADDKQTDQALEMICKKISRTEPVIENSPDAIAGELDGYQIWHLLTAISYNMTPQDKKKLE